MIGKFFKFCFLILWKLVWIVFEIFFLIWIFLVVGVLMVSFIGIFCCGWNVVWFLIKAVFFKFGIWYGFVVMCIYVLFVGFEEFVFGGLINGSL